MWDFDYVLSSLFETLPFMFMGLMLLLIVIPFYLLAYLKEDESLKKKSKKELNKDE